ncbi:hypothetical protein OH773_21945 (plasmid) [Buttiauxella sp. WJP83]|uniref:hypothetical protein n=1 Tax=Buttiauxella sp. WJP83 TaxID=2986951 RepID=UPI0022DE4B10|nr:hypothetical protein [Buttiauxella sp. WJP83]WBM73027.1 hypothetical protein OH773_21945 [Buttiauxella sp. WJP83]
MTTKTDLSKIPSISGNNGYSLRCPEVKINGGEAFCGYSVCQHTILAYKEKRLPAGSFASCAKAIATGKCKALKMMVEEIRAGKSLYFVDMTALIREVEERNNTVSSLTKKRGSTSIQNLVKRTKKAKPAEPMKPTKELAPVTDVYAALIEETTKEEAH